MAPPSIPLSELMAAFVRQSVTENENTIKPTWWGRVNQGLDQAYKQDSTRAVTQRRLPPSRLPSMSRMAAAMIAAGLVRPPK